MRTRTPFTAWIAAWAIAVSLAGPAMARTAPQQQEDVELKRPPNADRQESVELRQLPPVEKRVEPLKIPPKLLFLAGSTTTVFVVRHAEKELTPPFCPPDPSWEEPWWRPPCLTAEGKARAQQLLRLLQVLEPSKEIAIYSTQWNRTWQTALPTAEFFGVDISLYGSTLEVANKIRQEQIGKKVLVVSHSGLLREIVKHLGAPEGSCEIEDEYDSLCIVALSGAEFAGFVHLHYGGQPPKPDLAIESLRRHPLQPQAGDTVTFTATVKNVGAAAAGACKLSLKASWKSVPQVSDLPALAPGQAHSVEYPATGAVAGRQHIAAKADLQNSVQESDESNNQRSSYFTVQPSDQLPVRCRTASDCGSIRDWNCCEPGTPLSRCVRKPALCP